MCSQLEIPCLGRPFKLGMLYDCRTDKLIAGITLWNAKKLESAKHTSEVKTPSCFGDPTIEDTIKDKLSSVGADAELKLSFLSGMVEVDGAAKFLHDKKSSKRQSRVFAKYISDTHFEQLTMDQLGDIEHPEILDLRDVTHVVTGITYGGDAYFVFERTIKERENKKEISAKMKLAVTNLPSYAGGGGAGASLNYKGITKTETDKFQCHFYGDFEPKSIPTTFEDAIKCYRELPTLIKKEPKPKTAKLWPLSRLQSGNSSQIFHPIPFGLVSQVENIIDNFHKIEMHANDLLKHDISNKFADIESQLKKLKNLLYLKDYFSQKLSQILPKIRSTGSKEEEQKLSDLIFSVSQSLKKMESYLDGKEREIKQLTQHLKNMDTESRVWFDFPDTECDLTTLITDRTIKHVVCFAFNVTSESSPCIENLEKQGETKPADENDQKEWFDIPEVEQRLRSEEKKFLDFIHATPADTKIEFVVTSSNNRKVDELSPSITVYTDGVPILFDLPGTPLATNVTIDSITLTWRAPKHGKTSSYKVLYRSADEYEFKSIDSRGIMTTCYVNNLSHGVEYQFKVQATTESGFTVESDIANIPTTKYFDIVLIGQTGKGKSTLGNKLLDLEHTDKSKIRLFPSADDKKKRFTQANDPEVTESGKEMLSVTQRCKLMSNEDTKIRVLDVPGFSDSGTLNQATGYKVSVYNGNLQIVRYVVREQILSQLKVRRIVYFLPVRGPLEKADGTMQEELKVLHHYFGKDVFNCIIVAATNLSKEKYQVEFDEEDYDQTKEVFHLALKQATNDQNISCPPIVYLGFNDSPEETLSKIQSAPILKDSILPLKFTSEVCAVCSFTIRYNNENKEKICVVDTSGKSIPYEESKCHPRFVPKFSDAAKFFGGLGHTAMLGIPLLVGHIANVETWPGFTNSDEICIACKNSPGSEGCELVGTKKIFHKGEKNEMTFIVDHSNKL